MNRPFDSRRFEAFPVIGILRGLPANALEPLIEAVRRGGLVNLEITMNTPGAADQIRRAVDQAGADLQVGAGTVTSVPLLESALAAGAAFMVTPTLDRSVVVRCVELGVPVFPGAFSPREIVEAWDLGATMVKVFPADTLGPGYIRSIKAPFPQIRLLPTGGVDLERVTPYLEAGADGFGVGTPLFRTDRIAASDWTWVEAQCRAFAEACRSWRVNAGSAKTSVERT